MRLVVWISLLLLLNEVSVPTIKRRRCVHAHDLNSKPHHLHVFEQGRSQGVIDTLTHWYREMILHVGSQKHHGRIGQGEGLWVDSGNHRTRAQGNTITVRDFASWVFLHSSRDILPSVLVFVGHHLTASNVVQCCQELTVRFHRIACIRKDGPSHGLLSALSANVSRLSSKGHTLVDGIHEQAHYLVGNALSP